MKNKKILIVGIVLVAAVLIYLFWPNIKALFSKQEQPEQPEQPQSNATATNTNTTANTSNTSNTGNSGNTVIKPIKVGDSVLAAKDLVKAFDMSLNSVVKTYKKGDWVGLVVANKNGWLAVEDTAGMRKQVQKIHVKRA